MAVGHGPEGSGTANRAGSLAWKIVPSPNGPGSIHLNQLQGVSCPSASACIAVGGSAPQSLAERWNGTAWTILATPQRPIESSLTGVSCVSAQDCTAVGFQGSGTLAETWNGTTWTVVPTPNVASKDSTLASVSCVSVQACTAVGSAETSNRNEHSKTLVESWNGTAWTIVPSPRLAPRSFDVFTSVSCVSAGDCTAVGVTGGGDKPLIEIWNGTAWKVVPGATGPKAFGSLDGVVCLSATACTAVGSVIGRVRAKTLIESWNGTAWTIVPSPNEGPASAFNDLDSISCASAADCTAVGSFTYAVQHHPTFKTLIETWNGTAWTAVPSPNRGAAVVNALFGVSCASAVSCSAVGDYGSLHRRKTLTEHGTSAA